MQKVIIIDGKKWELDIHSTMLSRRHSYHMVRGLVRYVRVRREKG